MNGIDIENDLECDCVFSKNKLSTINRKISNSGSSINILIVHSKAIELCDVIACILITSGMNNVARV